MGPLGRFQTLTERYGVHKKRNPGAAPKRSVSTATGQSTQNRRPALKELENRDEALKIVRSILDVESTPFHLVSYGEYAKAHGSFRSDVYKGYHFLCYANSTTCAKWLVCSFALNQGGCELSKAVRAFKPNSGTTSLNEHTKTHKRQPNAHFSNFVNVSQAAKNGLLLLQVWHVHWVTCRCRSQTESRVWLSLLKHFSTSGRRSRCQRKSSHQKSCHALQA